MNTAYRKALPGTSLDWFDAREAVDALKPVHDPLNETHLVIVCGRPVQFRHPAAGRSQANGRPDWRCARLEAPRRRRPSTPETESC